MYRCMLLAMLNRLSRNSLGKMKNDVYCRPKWWGKDFPYPNDATKYKAIQVPKDLYAVADVFNQKYIDSIPEEFVWKIITRVGCVWRSDKDFKEEFNVLG